MVERCDYYSEEEYQYALSMEEEYYREQEEIEDFIGFQNMEFQRALYEYTQGNISLEEALDIVKDNEIYTEEDFYEELKKYEESEKEM